MGFLWFGKKKKSLTQEDLDQLKSDILDGIRGAVGEIGSKQAPKFVDYEEEEGEIEEDLQDLREYYIGADSVIKTANLSNNTLVVMTQEGNIYTSTKAGKELYKKVLRAKSEQEIKALLAPELSYEERQEMLKKQRDQLFIEDIQKLMSSGDFEQEGESLYMKGIKLSIPKVMVKAFVEVIDSAENYQALKNFWYWLSTNPNPESREDLYKFIEHNEVKITPKGLLVLYRRVVSKPHTVKPLVSFVSTNYFYIKNKKKSPKNYYVAEDSNEAYRIVKAGQTYRDNEELLGSVYELYHNLPNEEGNEFTDAHTRKMQIKVGSIYSIPEENVDRSNLHSCSQGLHVASKSYNYSGFGDTPVMCLVNPSKVRAVPINEYGKMRVSEMFIVSVLEVDEHGRYMDEGVDLVNFDEEYFNIGVEELEQMAKSVNITELAEHKLLPQISFDSFSFITTELKKKIETRVVEYDKS